MSSSINDVLDAMIETLHGETGLLVHGIVDSPVLPCVIVRLATDLDIGESTYFGAFQRGIYTLPVVLDVLDSASDIDGAQRFVYEVISPFGERSVVRALFENATLGSDPDEQPGGVSACYMAKVARARFEGIATLFENGPRVVAARVDVAVTVTIRGEE